MLSSIKFRLIVWFLAVFLVLFTGLGFFLYYELREIVLDSVDNHIESELSFLSGILTKEIEHGHLEEGIAEITEGASGEYTESLSGHYYQLVTFDGNILGRSPSLSLAEENLPKREYTDKPIYENIIGPAGAPLRMLTISYDFGGTKASFQGADSLLESYHLLRSFRNILLIAFPVIFLVSITGIYYFSGLSLRTLNIFSGKIGRITERSLNERVDDQNIDVEIMPLAKSFNTMLGRLEKAFDRQREFLSDASHELRTPTAVIKSYCDVTLSRDRSEDEYKNSLIKINETTKRMSDIVTRILEVSRFESKIFQLKVQELALMEMLENAVKLVEPYANEQGVSINLTGTASTIFADRERLTEAFVNLVDNAVKYTKEGSRVDIELSRTDEYSVVTVTDTGIGIPGSDIDRIFDRFYRVDKGREEIAGTGLGLSIVKAIVDAHRGKIEVESDLGKGSTFKVSLRN
ncbi:MAG: ATP-binding protein [Thermodesulfobacteriota bacterium]